MGISQLRAELDAGYGWAVDWNLGTGSGSCSERPSYSEFQLSLKADGHLQRVSDSDSSSPWWYLPHSTCG